MSGSDAGRFRQVDAIFDAALDLPEDQRPGYVDRECGGDAELRSAVLQLLEAHRRSGGFLEENGGELLAPLLEDSGLLSTGAVAPPAQVGSFRVLGTLGEGGMGAVYLGERQDGQFRQRVALKLVQHPTAGDDLIRRFVEERRILALLEHPNIARLIDGGIAPDGRPWFAMEFVEGEPLDRYCESRGLSMEERLALFIQVCEAVSYAHQHLVIHRDLKPSNILVTADGQLKLLDFGIAKAIGTGVHGAEMTRTGMYVMTPEFAAPEQVRGEAVSTATDVYALGVLLFLLLTGRRPYEVRGRSPAEVERIVADREPPRPSSVADPAARRHLRGDLDAVVSRALRKEPGHRYASVAELRDDLQRHRAGLPVQARPAGSMYRFRKFVRRNRTASAAAAVALLALVAATAFSSVQMREAQRQRDAARTDLRRQQALAEVQAILASDSRGENGRLLSAPERVGLAERVVLRRFAAEPWLAVELLTELAARLYELGERPAQRRLLERAGVIARNADLPSRLALIECQRAYSLTYDDQYDSARALLSSAGARLGRAPGDRIASASCAQARALLLSAEGEPEAAVTLLTRTLADTSRADLPIRDAMVFELASALRAAGRTREAVGYYRPVVARMDALGYAGSDILSNAFSWLTSALYELGEIAAVDSAARALIGNQSDVRGTYSSGVLAFSLGLSSLRRGQLDSAEVWLARAQRDTTEAAGGLTAYLPPALAQLRLEQGRYAEAREHIRALPTGTLTRRANAAWFGAWLRYGEGDRHGAARMLEDSLRLLNGGAARPKPPLAMPYVLAAEWRLASGDARTADSLALLGRAAAAVDSLALERSGYVGRAQLVHARALLAMGGRERARAAADSAILALRHGLGASPHTRQADAFRASLDMLIRR